MEVDGIEALPNGLAKAPSGSQGERSTPDPVSAWGAGASTSLNPRLAPQDMEAERSVLGGVLLTNAALVDISDQVAPEDFYREPHRRIFVAMQELSLRGEPIDVITLGDELRKRGDLEAAGGAAYLAGLDASVPTTGNVGRYARIVHDKALARRLIEAAHTIAREGYEQLGGAADLIDSAQRRIFAASDMGARGSATPLDVATRQAFAHLEALYERQSAITGIPSGFETLDRLTAGFQKGDLVIVAGRPSMGKTSLVMNIVAHVGLELGLPVAVFSLEMSVDSLTTRLFSSEGRVDGQRLRNGKLIDSDWPKLARAADRMFRSPHVVLDDATLSVMEMRSRARRVKAKHGGIGLVVVDYLQLMKGHGGDSREQEVSEISCGLKALAKELECPVIALSQLNRSLERREDKRPQMADLRESGALEQDADLICFIYRDEVYNQESADKGIAEIIIAKQRNGPTGVVRVAFLRDFTRFENLADDQHGPGWA
jgi:replicative DNA helicase